MFDSSALTKIQSLILIAVVIVAIGGAIVYVLLSTEEQSSNTIKIGFCGDLDMNMGSSGWKGAVLAVEEINAEGGLLGKKIELIGEDSDYESSGDIVVASQAFTRLITYHNVDFIISSDGDRAVGTYQDISSEHKTIYFAVAGLLEAWTQRVLDEYDQYKYFFRTFPPNSTSTLMDMADSINTLRDYSGFNKIGLLTVDLPSMVGLMEGLNSVLSQSYAFDVLYVGKYPIDTVDFSSYYAGAETAGVEILVPLSVFMDGIPLAKEHYDRQSPMVSWGLNVMISTYDGWESVEGKCEDMSLNTPAVTAGHPLTSQTLPLRNSFLDRWEDTPDATAASAYDTIRFILANAIEDVGNIDTDLIIEELEKTEIETAMARNFVFTSSHDVMLGKDINDPEKDFMLFLQFQWQDGEMVPVYPKKIMEETGATYTFPDWPGPWDNP